MQKLILPANSLTIEQELAALRNDPTNGFSDTDIERIREARTATALAREEQRLYNETLAAAQPFADAFATGITSGLQEIVQAERRQQRKPSPTSSTTLLTC